MDFIDTDFDVRSDSNGQDPDSHSSTLRKYHRLLWTKPLPSGELFQLEDISPSGYLYHKSSLGEFFLSSDSISHSYGNWKSLVHILNELPEGTVEEFRSIGSTIGAYILFPGNRINLKPTINGARGMNRKISDRFDLTLECIRRHYLREENPLSDTLTRYSLFFNIFIDFKGYVDFFLLNSLVSGDYLEVKFFLPFDNFNRKAVPLNVEEYLEYKANSNEFVKSRNEMIRVQIKEN